MIPGGHLGEEEGVDPEYDAFFDRSAPLPNGDPWDLEGPDGIIDLTDLDGLVAQFSHNCM